MNLFIMLHPEINLENKTKHSSAAKMIVNPSLTIPTYQGWKFTARFEGMAIHAAALRKQGQAR